MVPRIEISTKGMRSEVSIDGHKLDKVRSVRFEHDAGTLPVLSIDFVAADLYLDGEFVPALPEPFGNWYTEKAPSETGEADKG